MWPIVDALRLDSLQPVGASSNKLPVLVHVRKAGGTSLRSYLRQHWLATNRTHAHIEFGMLPLPCLRQPGLLLILALREPIERHASEFYYAGPGRNNRSAGHDMGAWRQWMAAGNPEGAFHHGLYVSNYLTRALTGLCHHSIDCPMNEPGCKEGAQQRLICPAVSQSTA